MALLDIFFLCCSCYRNRQVDEQVLATRAEMVSDVHVQITEETSQHAATNLDDEIDGYLAPMYAVTQ